jgi:hypothetical protein
MVLGWRSEMTYIRHSNPFFSDVRVSPQVLKCPDSYHGRAIIGHLAIEMFVDIKGADQNPQI